MLSPEDRARELSENLRATPENVFTQHGLRTLARIESSIHSRYSIEQFELVTKLSQLVKDSHDAAYYEMADYVAGCPRDFQLYRDLGKWRIVESQWHAIRMLDVGLITRQQEEFRLFKTFSQRPGKPWLFLGSKTAQGLLGVTKRQMDLLAKNNRKEQERRSQVEVMPTDPTTEWSEQCQKELRSIEDDSDAANRKVMTEPQWKALQRLTVMRPAPLAPADLPKLESSSGVAQISEKSDVFRRITENLACLELSKDQKERLHLLEEIVQQGLLWIAHFNETAFPAGDPRNDAVDPVGQTQREFLTHADHFALLAILTQPQTQFVLPNIHDSYEPKC